MAHYKEANAFFSRVLRDFTPRYISPSIDHFFGVHELLELSAPAQIS